MKLTLSGKHGGFTLIEILVVIAIMAALSVAAWEAYGMIENRKLNQQAQMEVAKMEAGMYQYNADGFDFPAGTGNEHSSHVLYTTLTCDTDNDGEPNPDKKGQIRTPYCPELVAVIPGSDTIPEGILCYKVSLNGGMPQYAVIDPWGRPYRYRLGFEQTILSKGKSKKTVAGSGMNPDFDIFSLGPDGEGDCLTKEGDGNDDNVSNIKSW